MPAFVTVEKEGVDRPNFHQFSTSSLLFYWSTSFYKKFIFVVSSFIDLLLGNGQFTGDLAVGESTADFLKNKKNWITYTPSPYTMTYE